MNAPEPAVGRKVRQWLDYAAEDLCLARHAPSLASAVPWRLVAYHAQQCAEKCLKAFLVREGVDFPYTHNIAHLLELCGDREWVHGLREAEELTPFAVTTRYPGEDEEVSEEEARRAIALAERVQRVLAERLSAYLTQADAAAH